jgi:hypothetical protein
MYVIRARAKDAVGQPLSEAGQTESMLPVTTPRPRSEVFSEETREKDGGVLLRHLSYCGWFFGVYVEQVLNTHQRNRHSRQVAPSRPLKDVGPPHPEPRIVLYNVNQPPSLTATCTNGGAIKLSPAVSLS